MKIRCFKGIALLLSLLMLTAMMPVFAESIYGPVEIVSGERTLTFTEMPTRVISLEDHFTEELLALGLEEYIIGRCESNVDEILPEYQEAYSRIPVIETQKETDSYPSFEVIVSMEPDLVLCNHFGDDYNPSFEAYAEAGIQGLAKSAVYAETPSPENVYQDIMNLGRIFNVEDRAQELVDELKGSMETVKETIGEIESPVTVVVCDFQDGNEVFTAGKHLESQLIELAGGVNVFAATAEKSWMRVSAEEIVAANPDVILFNDYGSTSVEEKIATFKATEAFADIPAVVNDRMCVIGLHEVYDSLHIAVAVEKMAKQFYPNKF